jgi:Ca2+-binding RTX toxin-like protein
MRSGLGALHFPLEQGKGALTVSSRIWLVALAGLLCLLAPSAAQAAVRYAAPGGSGTACSQAAPCGIQTAVEAPAVVSGDEIVLGAGTYLTGSDPLASSDAISIHPAAGAGRPLIISSSGFAVVLGALGTLDGVDVQTSVPGIALIVSRGAVARRVIAISTADSGIGCYLAPDPSAPPLLQESGCIASGSGGVAVQSSGSVSAGTAAVASLQDVTAVATGPSSEGVKAISSGSGGSVTVKAANVIASGTAFDATADGGSGGSLAFAQFTYSDFDTQHELTNAAVTDPGYDSNVTGPPMLANPAVGDIHQKAGSFTVDRGGGSTSTDIDGDSRPQGAAPDIGADELTVTAKSSKCFGQSPTIVAGAPGAIKGTPGKDVIVGTPGRDAIDSGPGRDLICSLGGRDKIRAGAGPDKVRAAGAADKLFGGEGRDRLLGGAGRDRIKGGPGRDVVRGGGGKDICRRSRHDRTSSCE